MRPLLAGCLVATFIIGVATADSLPTHGIATAKNSGSCVSVTANTTVVSANPGRHALYLLPPAANTDKVYVKLGATATTAQPPLAPGQPFNLDPGPEMYVGQVDALAASGTQSICVFEY